MLIDQGGLVRLEDDKTWQATDKTDALIAAVPGTVKDLILARFDRLPETVRQTLQRASVLGTSFSNDMLFKLLIHVSTCQNRK